MESIIGQKMLDRDGDAIGKITDVIFDATTLEPERRRRSEYAARPCSGALWP